MQYCVRLVFVCKRLPQSLACEPLMQQYLPQLCGMFRTWYLVLSSVGYPFCQALSFLLLGSFVVALLVLVGASVPISAPMVLEGDHVIWILWLVAPILATSFLASPADGSVMKRTPEKNDPKAS